ncbi:ABC transporter ATP-binding protein/permease [Pendulispora brunnea]|uniref:ABC transporter ATP-binding protein/permease n=1 Tax=Pendulispora brunnea TaxID=2905690 RepID=A0ABZ2KG78_9BACT
MGIGALTVMNAVLPLAIAYVGKRIVDAVVAHDAHATWQWVLAELGLVATLAGATQALSLVRRIVGARLGLDINVAILEKATTLELRHFEDPEFYDRLTKARREASSRPLSVITRAFQMLQSVISLFGYAALLLRFSGWAVAALLLAAIPATVAEMRFSTHAFRLRNWRSPESRKLMYLEYVLSNDEHAKEVKLFGLGSHLLTRYRDIGELFYREDTDLSKRAAKWAYVLSLLATLTFYGCYASMALSAVRGTLTLGDLTLGMVAFRQGQQAFQSLLSAFGGMVEDNLYMSNLFAYLAPLSPVPVPVPVPASALPPARAGIHFDNVGFRYPGREEWALRHVNVIIPERQSLALVGQNGAGKTTFIKLLTRLYEPTEGRILLDGKDLRDWDEADLRRRIGVVFQDFAQYQFTARENVGLGSIDDLEDIDQVGRAVSKGGAEAVVAGLKQGLETPLGRWFADGVELSGGQWQKIALARAFMREGADILVLDEPTAALDAEAEHAVFERFRELTRDKTSILISHRFPTVRMADRILVIEHGKVVEEGTHDALLAQNGRYAHLFSLQAQGYL